MCYVLCSILHVNQLLHNFAFRYDNLNALEDALDTLAYDGGNTNTSGGLRVAMQEVFEDGGAKRDGIAQSVAIVITDGVSTRDSDRTLTDAEAMQNDPYNVQMFSVGVTSQIDVDELRGLSSDPKIEDQNYFRSPDFDQLDEIITGIFSSSEQTSWVWYLMKLLKITIPLCGVRFLYHCIYFQETIR